MRSRTGPLRLRVFRWSFAGRLASLTGSAMTPVALAFAVLDASGRVADLAVVLAAQSLPMLSPSPCWGRGPCARWRTVAADAEHRRAGRRGAPS
ncbi:hypothetical protein GCM10017691_26300 [Pseudonocardia petroleophila]|uniref:MFS transporter n=1 Tax=Pseudonocardia petroleophila TaxID=37331 RepID=A0A7G7MFA1_9PSEU|nr:MFS transporter [Pseudonocardia petroleophila]QNG51462.1 MFS transporter [Pseudonocardia petroleophila]